MKIPKWCPNQILNISKTRLNQILKDIQNMSKPNFEDIQNILTRSLMYSTFLNTPEIYALTQT